MRRILIAAAIAAAALFPTAPAEAYCEYTTEDGGCTNSCIETARLFKKLTGRDAPWMCPM